ncbi:glycosyltransferase family 4 protein [Pseudomonas sp. NPDC090202]|uniref:glycosyltransferase family 4 protein n=1 Tax=unclassified Pseudomonas TaxID=196821 RepID=UPI0037F5E1C1
MRILWTLPYMPWPISSPGNARQFHLLRNLAARGHRITLLVHACTAADADTRAALEPWLERLIVIPRRPRPSLRTLLFARPPMLATLNGFSPQLQATFESLLAEHWDVIQIEHSYSFQPFEAPLQRHGKPFVMTEHRIESSIESSSDTVRYQPLPEWTRLLHRLDQWRYRQWETRVFSQSRQLIAVTEDDAKGLARLTARATAVVANGVDCDHYARITPDRHSQRLLFLVEDAAGCETLSWLLAQVMPRLWRLAPQARLSIGGQTLTRQWRQRWSDARIEWPGPIDDLRTLQKNAAIFLATPGDDSDARLNVLQAMAAGLTVVAGTAGYSGLNLIDGEHYLRYANADDLVRRLANIIEQPAQLVRIGEAGRAHVRQQHDWSVSASRLEGIYSQVRRARAGH